MARRTKAQIALDLMIQRVENKALQGYQIDIMKLSAVSKAAKEAAALGKTEQEVYLATRAVVEQIGTAA